MLDTDESRVERAVRVAVAIARDHQIDVADPAVLADRSNVMVHLRPARIVARIANTTAAIRSGDSWLAREIQVTRHLAAAGAPIVSPARELPAELHRRDGLAVTFWRYVEPADAPVDPRAAGRALRTCHDILRDYRGALTLAAPLREAHRVVEMLAADGTLDVGEAAFLRDAGASLDRRISAAALRPRPIHGDAHLRNVLASSGGPLWTDWEDTFAGPLEWDLACLVEGARVLGADVEASDAALAGHGAVSDPALLDLLVQARAYQAVAWGRLVLRDRPDAPRRAQADARLAWLRARIAPT